MMLFSHPSTTSLLSDQQHLTFVLAACVVTFLLNAGIAHLPQYVAPEVLSLEDSMGLAQKRQCNIVIGSAARSADVHPYDL